MLLLIMGLITYVLALFERGKVSAAEIGVGGSICDSSKACSTIERIPWEVLWCRLVGTVVDWDVIVLVSFIEDAGESFEGTPGASSVGIAGATFASSVWLDCPPGKKSLPKPEIALTVGKSGGSAVIGSSDISLLRGLCLSWTEGEEWREAIATGSGLLEYSDVAEAGLESFISGAVEGGIMLVSFG